MLAGSRQCVIGGASTSQHSASGSTLLPGAPKLQSLRASVRTCSTLPSSYEASTSQPAGFSSLYSSRMQLGANALPRPLLHRPGRRPLAPPLPAKGGNDKKGGSSGSSSGGSSGKGKPAGKPEESKADFSALWAQRFKQFFSARRQYLAQADVSPEEEQAQKEYQRKLDADKSKLADMKVAYKEARLAVLGEQYAAGEEVMKKYDVEALKAEGASQEEIEAAQQTLTASGRSLIEVDVDRARQEMLTSPSVKVAIGVARTRDILKGIILFPITFITSLHAGWQSLFTSQSYQNFLMSEGERIWFWRNRMENERWFWERYAWDQLFFPAICAIGYQMVTPANFIWAVVVPLALSIWQHGRMPGLFSIDFWAIAYLGFYQKVWPRMSVSVSNAVFGW